MSKRITLHDHIRETELFFRRSRVLVVLVFILSVFMITRLWYLQIFEHDRYTTLSEQNQLNVIPIEPNRGLIYDRNGVLLAENVPVFSLEITPDRVKNLKTVIDQLQKIIQIDEDDLKHFYKEKHQRRSFDPVTLKLKLTDEEVAKFSVNQFKFPGIAVKARLLRRYPLGPAFAHVVGYVGRINEEELKILDPSNYAASNFVGKIGIEKSYEKLLHGKVGTEQVETDASGREVRILRRTAPTPGKDIYLTIDSGLEIAAERALEGHRGSVVAIDPRNGEVLALVSAPSYDPNLFVKGISSKAFNALNKSLGRPLYNRAIRGQYPFASTIKPFLAVQGLDTGVLTRATRIRDPGWFKLPFSSHEYKDWRKGGHGTVDTRRAIVISCDTFFYTLAYRMGINRIDNILTRFGFGIKTGIEMAEELPGLVPSPAWKLRRKAQPWYPGDTVISGIGQGYMLTTPLQLAAGMAALSKHGHRWQPHLLLRSIDTNRQTQYYKPRERYPVQLKKDWVWHYVNKAMREVITVGTGYRFGRDAPYTVAAKTGTAQVFSSKFHAPFKKKDLPEHLRDHTLFIAYAPIDNPKIAVAVVAEHSSRASNIAREVMDYYLLTEGHMHERPKN